MVDQMQVYFGLQQHTSSIMPALSRRSWCHSPDDFGLDAFFAAGFLAEATIFTQNRAEVWQFQETRGEATSLLEHARPNDAILFTNCEKKVGQPIVFMVSFHLTNRMALSSGLLPNGQISVTCYKSGKWAATYKIGFSLYNLEVVWSWTTYVLFL